MNIQHIPCTAHKLNLIVQQVLFLTEDDLVGEESNELRDSEKIKLIFKKCRNIVGFLNAVKWEIESWGKNKHNWASHKS